MDEFDMLLKPAAKPAAGADEFDSMLAPAPRRAKPVTPAFELEAQAQLKKGVFEGVVKPAATDLLSAATDLIDFVAGGAVAMPLASFSEGVTRAQDFVEGAVGINRRTRKEAGERGLAAASAVNEKYGTPARTLLQSWGWLPKVEGAGQKALGAVMELVGRDAAAIEERTGGAVVKEDVLSLVNTLFGAAGAKGVQAGAGRVVDAKKAKIALQELNALKAERGAEALAAEEGAVPAGRQPQPNDPTRMHQQVRDANLAAADARVNAERLAYELMRDGAPLRKVEAIVKRNPLVGVAMEEITARRQAANRFAEEPDLPPITPQGTFREGALGAMLRQPADMSLAEVALREQAQGLKRGPLGEPIDGTSAQASVAAIDYLQDRVITEAPAGPDLPPTIKRGPLGEPIEAAPTTVPGPLGVPVERTAPSKGRRGQQFGGADGDLMNSVALIGGGAALVSYLSSPENRLKNAGIAAAITGLALFARSRSPQVADWASQAGRGAEYTLGMVSTQIGNISAPLLHRMREHERKVLTTTHDQLKAVATFIETSRALPTALREKLDAVILSGDSAATIKLLGQSGRPDLVVEWRKARDVLNQIGKDLVQTGRLKGLIADYFPRIAIDVPGLLNALGKEDRSFLQVKLDNARARAAKIDGRDLSPLEESQIINGFLKSHSPTSGKSGFLKKRSVEEITPELVRFYATFSEALPLYIRAAVKEIERARFFGEDLVRQEGGLTNVDMSIGNLVNRERLAGKIDDAQAEKLRSLLASRFGPGEKSASGLMQAAKNLTNAGLLGHVTSAVTQLGDIASSVFAHDMLPTLKSAQQVITRKPGRISVKDIGLADHITEEIVGGEKKPMTVFGRQLSSAKFLQGVFKYSGFSLVDQLGKNISIGASFEKSVRLAQTEAGVAKLRAKYGEAYGPEFPQLIADLRSRANTEAVRGLLFSELSDIQPISKIEVPQAYLDHPNVRVFYMMKTFMLKQADIVRREGFAEINRGNVAKGTSNLLRYGLALGIAGATTDFIRNWLLGRDQDLDWGAIPENALKTFGWSQVVVEKARKGQPFQAVAGFVAPPYKMWEKIVTDDPQAIQYLPLAGRLLYHDAVPGQSLLGLDFGGAEKANKAYEQRRRREEKE